MRATVILVVEDEWALRGAVAQALRAAGWHVLDAGSGEAAIGLLHACLRPISGLFTGVQLSGLLSGWDVADAVRKSNPAARIIYAAGNNIERSRQISGSAFLEKPYRAQDIVAAFANFE